MARQKAGGQWSGHLEQLLSVWSALSLGRRITVLAASAAVFMAVLTLGRMASAPTMTLLYAGLEPQATADVIASLEGQGVAYEVRGNALYVEAARRDRLRITLAGEGLPASGAQGYELLDQLTGFGTTAQMFDAAYWRAKEGELARTITASPLIRSARVHIANPAGRPFQRDQTASASVTVSAAGGGLPASHAKALKFLVASAVAGLSPEDVTIIDSNGGLIASDEPGDGAALGGEDRAALMKRKVERILEARVGYGNAVVEVSLDTESAREEIMERVIDPDSRVAISSEKTETNIKSNDTRSGAVTVASNLPDGDGAGGSGAASSSNTESRELTNFEVSETQREVVRSPGDIKRLTVAVLIDGVQTVAADGSTTWAPRPAEELNALRSLVASAVGFDAARGDEITIQSLEFEPVLPEGSAPTPGLLDGLAIDVMSMIQLAVLAIVALVLGLFVVRPIFASASSGGRSGGPVAELAPPPASAPLNVADPPPLPALNGEISTGGPGPDVGGLPALPDLADLGDFSPAGSGAVERLKEMISEREEETAEILRTWVENPSEAS